MYSVGYLRYTFYARYPVMSVFVLAKRRLMVLDEQMGGGRRRRGKAPKMLYFDRSTWHGKKIIIKNKIKRRRRRCIGKEKKHARRRWLRAKRRLDVCARGPRVLAPDRPRRPWKIRVLLLYVYVYYYYCYYSRFSYFFFRLPSELGTYYSPVQRWNCKIKTLLVFPQTSFDFMLFCFSVQVQYYCTFVKGRRRNRKQIQIGFGLTVLFVCNFLTSCIRTIHIRGRW